MKNFHSYISSGADETKSIGSDFSGKLAKGSIVALYGELGTGKTQFVKGICSGLDVKELVNSPTFVIINEYDSKLGKIYHFDFYRVNSLNEILDLGFEEYLEKNGIVLIEWPELIESILPVYTKKVYLSHLDGNENSRKINVEEN